MYDFFLMIVSKLEYQKKFVNLNFKIYDELIVSLIIFVKAKYVIRLGFFYFQLKDSSKLLSLKLLSKILSSPTNSQQNDKII